MEENLDIEEGQRLAAAKDFAHRHRFLLAAIVAAAVLGAAAGWGYSRYQKAQRVAASGHYQEGIKALKAGRDGDARQAFKTLIADYSGTSYAAMGRVLRARLLHADGDAGRALEVLKPLVQSGGAEIRQVAVEESARIQWQQGDVKGALATLETVAPGAYMPSYFQLRGDLLAADGRPEAARNAYQRGLNRAGSGPLSQDLEVRLDQLPAEEAGAGEEGGA